jgi:hypothetical protein
MFNIQELAFFLLVAIAIILGAFMLYSKYIAPKINKEVPQAVLDKVRTWALDVVCFIEQTYPESKDKKLVARDRLKRLLAEVNIFISDSTIDLMIEAAVFYMNTTILDRKDKYIKDVKLNE